MGKKLSNSEKLYKSLAGISEEQIKNSVYHTWNEEKHKIWEPDVRTYYIYEGLEKWARISIENHLFLLHLLRQLNIEAVYIDRENKEEMIAKIDKAIQGLIE
ncbi:hypothetical protein [Priestia aryabhattai]